MPISSQPSKNERALMTDLNTMTRLHGIATRFVQEGDVSALLLEIIDAAIAITNADKGNIQLVNEEKNALEIVANRGFGQAFLEHFTLCPFGKGTCGTAFQSKERIIVDDITLSPIFAGTPDLAPLLAEDIRAVQSTLLKNSAGKILGVLSTHYRTPQSPEPHDLQMMDLLARLSADIIERDQWIKERAKWLEKLREVDRRKDDFLAVLSHELRNPLASISNSIFTLSHSATGSDIARRAQATAERQVTQMTRLVDDLLDVTRISRNKISLRLQLIDVNDLVGQTIEDYRSFFERANISLQAKLADAPIMINVDPVRIAQVVGNILHNAVKFTQIGGETCVEVYNDEKSRQVIIRVIDNGIGIEPSLLENIFAPFMQVDRTLDHSKGGLGLGLALVKGLVEQHGGTTNITSAGFGKGTEVMIRLPLCHKSNDVDKNIVMTEFQKLKPRPKLRILLIEDNIDVAESLYYFLATYGHHVDIAHDGLDGIQKARDIIPDLVLCDIGLPNTNGFEVARMIKTDPILQSIFLIGLSGYAQSEYVEKAYAVGFDRYLTKPLNLNLLEQLLASRFRD